MTVRQLKKTFNCGGDTIQRVRKAIQEKKPLEVPGRKRFNPVRDDQTLVALVDSITGENGAVSDADLAHLLGTSKSTVNRIRHDLHYSFCPLRHGPLLEERKIEALSRSVVPTRTTTGLARCSPTNLASQRRRIAP